MLKKKLSGIGYWLTFDCCENVNMIKNVVWLLLIIIETQVTYNNDDCNNGTIYTFQNFGLYNIANIYVSISQEEINNVPLSLVKYSVLVSQLLLCSYT